MDGGTPETSADSTQRVASTWTRPKRSFLRLPVPVDVPLLRAEYDTIPEDAWGVSYWDVHCSIDVLLLRGGNRGVEDDFGAVEVHDAPIVARLPCIERLLASDGPLGGARYAFLFRTKPGGITRVHDDQHEMYQRAMRIHVPIITNPGAFLLSEGRSKHFAVGETWTFDNQAPHSVVNGDTQRVHLIIDVDPNPVLAALVDRAVFDPGEEDPERWARTIDQVDEGLPKPYVPVDGDPLTISEKRDLGLPADGFATRIVAGDLGSSVRAALLRFGMRPGDVVVAIDGVTSDPRSRTALDHLRTKHRAGETVRVDVLRGGRERSLTVDLKPTGHLALPRSAREVPRRAHEVGRSLLLRRRGD